MLYKPSVYNTLYTRTLSWHVLTPAATIFMYKNISEIIYSHYKYLNMI